MDFKQTRKSFAIFVIGAAVAAAAWIWRFNSPPPGLWESIAAAAGLRPPAEPLPTLWLAAVAPLFRFFGIGRAVDILMAAGPVALGVFAMMSCALLERLLPNSLRRGERVAKWWRAAVLFVVGQGAVLLCLSDPVWNAFRCFSPTAFGLLAASAAAILFIDHLKTGSRLRLYFSFAVLGALAADSLSGGILTLAAILALRVRKALFDIGILRRPAEENPLSRSFFAWKLTLALLAGAAAAVAVDANAFASLKGLEAQGWNGWDYVLALPRSYLIAGLTWRDVAGVVLGAAAVAVFLAVEVALLLRSTDDDKSLLYLHGLAFAAFGILAFSQLSGAKALWLGEWMPDLGHARLEFVRCLFMFACALSVTWALAVFTMELYLRNFRRIAFRTLPDAAEEKEGEKAIAGARLMQRIVRVCLFLEPVAALAFVLPFRPQELERAMLGVVVDAVRETAEECRDVDFLFTDGGLDAAVEISAAEEGRTLNTLSLMGASADRRGKYLRARGAGEPKDKALLEQGAPDALRMWMRTRPDMAAKYAVQIGFELWQRDSRPMPRCSGLVARPEGFSDEDVRRGSAAAHELAARIVGLYDAGDPDGISDRALRDAFIFVQWRLAVLARHRANERDAAGDAEAAMDETILADTLDGRNSALGRIRANFAWGSRKRLERMTPQEGLRLGLRMANFAMARPYAQSVLSVDPDNAEANFAIGMDFFVQGQYSRAAVYLERCLAGRPNDPSVLNNLAQCHIRLGDPDKALPYAKRALELLPDSPEVRKTYKRATGASR